MAKSPKAPTIAPHQIAPSTGEGQQGKTTPTFNQSPTLKPNPPDNGIKKVQPDRQPARQGPATASTIDGGQAQQVGRR